MRIVIVGASGTVGKTVRDAMASTHHVIAASRHGDVTVDIGKPESIAAMYAEVGQVEAVVCTAGVAAFAPLNDLTNEDFEVGLHNKLMGQVNLVRFGIGHVQDGGSFTLTSGLWGHDPMPGATLIALVNAGIEGFVRAAALELPRGIRINAVSPPLILETAIRMGWGEHGMPAKELAGAYIDLVEGSATGTTQFPGG